MDNDDFKFKSFFEYIIKSDDLRPETISERLGVAFHRSHTKGDARISRTDGSVHRETINIWAVRTETIVSTEEGLEAHFEQLKSLLAPGMEILDQWKREKRVEMILWLTIATDDAGVGLEFTSKELEFMNRISHWVHFAALTHQDMEKWDV